MPRSLVVRLSVTAAAAALVTGGLSATPSAATPSAARPDVAPLARNIATSGPALHRALLAQAEHAGVLPAGVPRHGSYGFLLRLGTTSTTAAAQAVRAHGAVRARAAARAQLRAIDSAQARVISKLPAHTAVSYRVHALLSGVAVYTAVANYQKLQAIPNVTAVYPIAPKKPSLAYAVPFQRAPQAWQSYGQTGQNTTIALIDTGVDYTHADFGGPGTAAAYTAAKAHDAKPAAASSYDRGKFDATTKDSKGRPQHFYDFAGDAYNSASAASAVPHPDPNPLDCAGHGTHVAGIAAGYGENANGTTYTGSYDTSTPFGSMRIGPGMAPRARLWVYKVFGCRGATDVDGAAIDRAMDPNGDGSAADHADVINMSLGLDFGSAQDGDAVLADLAAKAGVTVVAAAGNAGDLYDVSGSPANAPRVIAVASSADAGNRTDSLTVSAPASIAGTYAALRSTAYDWKTKPNLSGDIVALSDGDNQDGCLPLDATDRAAVKGKVVLERWVGNDGQRRCGSSSRVDNLKGTGAKGALFADTDPSFVPGNFVITGNKAVPAALVAKPVADAVRARLRAKTTVTLAGTGTNYKDVETPLDDTLSGFSSRGIGAAGDLKPDLTAVGDTVFSTRVGSGNRGTQLSGTSMATPMVAGAAALVVGKHPGWSSEQVKADLMDTATHDLFTGPGRTGTRYAPNRVGTGRLDVANALDNSVLAYTADGPHASSRGNVSASFGPLAIRVGSGPHTYRKTIRVQNTGGSPAGYTSSFVNRTSVPGTAYSVQPGTIAVPAHSSRNVVLTLTVHPRQLTKTIDPTTSRLDGGLPRQYLADASGLVLLTSTTGRPNLRVAAYAAPRPASNMTQPRTVRLSKGAVQTAFLPLHGTSVNQGYGATAVRSIVAGFELQGTSGPAPTCSTRVTQHCIGIPAERDADLRYVGVTSDAPQLRRINVNAYDNGLAYFAVNTQGAWDAPDALPTYVVVIDGNGDGKADAALYTARLPSLTGGASDIPVTELVDLRSGYLLDFEPINDTFGDVDTALYNSTTQILPVAISAIPGVSRAHSRINYIVQGFSGYQPTPVDSFGWVNRATGILHGALSTNVLYPGVSVFGSYDGQGSALLYSDSPGSVLEVRRDLRSYRRDHGKGGLVLHLHNTGNKAQRVALTTR